MLVVFHEMSNSSQMVLEHFYRKWKIWIQSIALHKAVQTNSFHLLFTEVVSLGQSGKNVRIIKLVRGEENQNVIL